MDMSYLFYVDDVILMASRDQTNALNIVHILRCFFMASGLKINLLKSKLYGVGVTAGQVTSLAFRM